MKCGQGQNVIDMLKEMWFGISEVVMERVSKHDWFDGNCLRGNEKWMGLSVCLGSLPQDTQGFSHVNNPDRASYKWEIKWRGWEEKRWKVCAPQI